MKNFLRENWFNVIMTLSILVVSGSAVWYLTIFLPQKEEARMVEQKQQEAWQLDHQNKVEEARRLADQQKFDEAKRNTDQQVKIEKCKITAQSKAIEQTMIHGKKIPSALDNVNDLVNSPQDSASMGAMNDAFKARDELIVKQNQVMIAQYYNQFYYQCLNN